MKKISILMAVFLAGILILSPVVYAGWFSDMLGSIFGDEEKDLVGQAYHYGSIVTDKVTCMFSASENTRQMPRPMICKGYYGRRLIGSCQGVGECVATVRARKGARITWKSTCGGYAYTTMDGEPDYAEFSCGLLTDTDIVKCVFSDSTSEQRCYSDYNGAGCSGISACRTKVTGTNGRRITWKSSCGGYAYTTIDGKDDTARFSCTPVMNESVKCVFNGSASEQTCYSEQGSCKGVETCEASVSGNQGDRVTWKSSCGGYAYTTIDGQNEYAIFSCRPESLTAPVINSTNETEDRYYKAHWMCYDGYSIEATSRIPLISSAWRGLADHSCMDHCSSGKCGVNTFGVDITSKKNI